MNISSLLNANPAVPELNFTFIPYAPIDTPSTFYPPPAIVPQPPLVLHQPYLPNSLPLSEALPTVASLPSSASPSLTVSSPSSSTQPIAQSKRPAGLLTIIPSSTLSGSLDAAPTLPQLKQTFKDTGGATCFAGRNPLKDVQPPRFRVRGSQSDAVKLGQAERVAARSQKADELRDGVDAIIKSRDSEIKDLSERLFVTEKVIRALVNGETHYKKRREPNIFNALVHKATDEMNMGNVASALIFSGKADEHLPRPWPW